ncbi:MAG: transposase, partial [Desulfuromonadales bacterium]|nr:transposase [Desulfuromonadales bacterium]
MTFKPEIHQRRSIRLRDYDYSRAGAYFVTLCTFQRACLFGEVVDGEMRLNEAGRTVQKCWDDIPDHFPHVELDAFVVMPNHVHGIVVITDTDGAK